MSAGDKIVFSMALFFLVVLTMLGLRSCDVEAYKACLSKATEVQQCKELEP